MSKKEILMGKKPETNAPDKMDKPLPIIVILVIPVYVVVMFSLILFPISKDWDWPEAWLFIGTFAVNIGISYYVINKKNPRVVRNRMKTKKEGLTSLTKKSAGSDKFIFPFLGLGFLGALILPAIDHRFNWSTIAFVIEMIGLVLTNAGMIIMDIAMVQNAFASKILDINKEQTLIDTGMYGRVRHPLYSGAIIMILSLPIALGSWWGLIPAVIGVLSLVVRIRFEEDMLVKGMDGYTEYQSRVKHKLIPGIY
jgi:protein-S-isoprenylcysteine O-methyltransferase Ste14